MNSPIAVLKFGGSVLRGSDDLHRIAAKIERWRRRGYGIVCVVSAPFGTTDRRVEELRGLELDPHAYADALAEGERRSAQSLAATLAVRGSAARVLAPGAIGLVATGPPLDSSPASLAQTRLRACLQEDIVAIVPGFVAVDDYGRCVLFGRGGSDLTALFLAAELGAQRCVLVKDVDGLYDRDPHACPNARRYSRASWDAALSTDGSILQRAALNFAKHRGMTFEVGSVTAHATTSIGTHSSSFAQTVPASPLSVTLLGCGTVGQGVWDELARASEHFRIDRVAVRDLRPKRMASRPLAAWTDDPLKAAASDADLVVECMGDSDAALACIEVALARGSHVVTADKVLVSHHGTRLRRMAQSTGASFSYSAAIGGALPVLERLALAPPVSVRAVLNGTANFVLHAISQGSTFDDAVQHAQQAGYAEADPSRDLEGWDAAHKLALLAEHLGLGPLDPAEIPRTSVARGVLPGLRQVAELHATARGPRARVSLQIARKGDPLAALNGAWNGVEWTDANGSRHWIQGQGAGRMPTASSVLADAFDVARAIAQTRPRPLGELPMRA